jgi:hypothetical protein
MVRQRRRPSGSALESAPVASEGMAKGRRATRIDEVKEEGREKEEQV